MMGEYNRCLAKNLLYPNLPAFTQALIKGLQVPDGFTSDSGLKKEILSGGYWFYIYTHTHTHTHAYIHSYRYTYTHSNGIFNSNPRK